MLFVPPFGEEMNKCRRQITAVSEAFVRTGYATLVPDLFGTGDSAGDFIEATWTIWQESVGSCFSWCEQHGLHVAGLVGIRLGAVLAAETLRSTNRAVAATVLWQPVANGQQFVTQFLRLRIAASMMSGDKKETSEHIRARLGRGESLEIAGYNVSSELLRAIEALKLEEVLDARLGKLCILEVGGRQLQEMSISGQRLLAVARDNGLDSCGERLEGDPLWQSTEIVTNDDLTRRTVDFVKEIVAP